MQARVTRVAYRHSFALSRVRTSQYRGTFVLLSVTIWNDLSDPVFDVVELDGFHVYLISYFFLFPTIFSFSSFHELVVSCWGLRIDSFLTLSQHWTAD